MATQEIEVKIPDIGGGQVEVIEILVKPGETISVDTSLVTLESDKASMEIPSPIAGVVTKIKLSIGSKVAEGDVILLAEIEHSSDAAQVAENRPSEAPAPEKTIAAAVPLPSESTVVPSQAKTQLTVFNELSDSNGLIAAGPAVRRMARELGVNLSLVSGSGRKARITLEDVQAYVKERLSGTTTGSAFNLPSNPIIDFSQFGSIETKSLNKIKKLTGQNVHRSWITIPHVTQFDEADITDLEQFRKAESVSQGSKLTLLAFVCAAVTKALQVYPQFNASLDNSGESLIYKHYYNLGIAVETPNGLVVPVIKGTNYLSVTDIAKEMTRLSTKAREKGLMPGDMSGGCFTISSLGGIGGTAFTPIVNSPEVAILGLSRSQIKPIYEQGEFIPRLMLPLSLSYDHRVIDGAEAARFTRFISECLADMRKILL